jgi:hypothetical protein
MMFLTMIIVPLMYYCYKLVSKGMTFAFGQVIFCQVRSILSNNEENIVDAFDTILELLNQMEKHHFYCKYTSSVGGFISEVMSKIYDSPFSKHQTCPTGCPIRFSNGNSPSLPPITNDYVSVYMQNYSQLLPIIISFLSNYKSASSENNLPQSLPILLSSLYRTLNSEKNQNSPSSEMDGIRVRACDAPCENQTATVKPCENQTASVNVCAVKPCDNETMSEICCGANPCNETCDNEATSETCNEACDNEATSETYSESCETNGIRITLCNDSCGTKNTRLVDLDLTWSEENSDSDTNIISP